MAFTGVTNARVPQPKTCIFYPTTTNCFTRVLMKLPFDELFRGGQLAQLAPVTPEIGSSNPVIKNKKIKMRPKF